MAKVVPEILFEHEHYVVVNKPAGLLSIPDREGKEISLKNILQEKYGSIFTIHRLDRDTSGLIVFARDEQAHKFLSQTFESRTITKIYQGIVTGVLPEKKKTIDAPIMEHPGRQGTMVINKKGKPSVTDYEVLEEFGKFSLVQFQIHTGRTHQVRVHMQHMGHPVVCDELYGDGAPVLVSSFKRNFNLSKNEEQEKPILSRLGLHAFKLAFMDMDNQQIVIEAPLHKDMKALLQQLRKWQGNKA